MHISRGECDLGTPTSSDNLSPEIAATLTLTILPLYVAVAII